MRIRSFCVFADGSMIDEFGIWYHAADKFRYQPGDELPAVFRE